MVKANTTLTPSPLGLDGILIQEGFRSKTLLAINKPTSDDWSPNFPDGTVFVSLYEYTKGPVLWKFNVSGYDDTCMALYTDNTQKKDLTLNWILNLSVISKQDLLDWGVKYD